MTTYSEAEKINEILSAAEKILIIQADNPDSDSLSSALALEEILGDLGKQTYLYCGVNLPSYLMTVPGADRVSSEMPAQFDAGIIVDTNSLTLLAKMEKDGLRGRLAAKPVIVIDHHSTAPTIDFVAVSLNPTAVATAEVIYELASQLGWPLNDQAAKLLAAGILSDSLGLSSEATTARSVHIIGELVEKGVSLAELEDVRREAMRREPELIHYKGELLKRVEFHYGSTIATVDIPWEEIEKYSPLYNPAMLVIDDMRLGKTVKVAVVFKIYPDGKITGKIRTNRGWGIAGRLSEEFGGGGHPYAAGFKLLDAKDFNEVKNQVIARTHELLEEAENAS